MLATVGHRASGRPVGAVQFNGKAARYHRHLIGLDPACENPAS